MRKNNKGQALVLFVLLLPVLILFITYIIDTFRMSYEKSKMTNIGKLAIEYKNGDEELTNNGIIEFIKMNDNEIETTIDEENGYKIKLTKGINSLFSNIIGKDKYTIIVIVER